MNQESSCYCCARPSSAKEMDLDAALHELDMLSTPTESRRQFLAERNRSKSESGSSAVSRKVGVESSESSANGYQIIQINPTFVTGFMSEVEMPCKERVTPNSSSPKGASSYRGACSSGYTPCALGGSYRQDPDSLESEVRMHRLARIKLGRQRRFRKPYEVPWRLHHSLPLPEIQPPISPRDHRPPDPGELKIEAPSSPKTVNPSKSNNSSPVKISSLVIHRSKSLDDLDLAKLKITEFSQDQNFVSQRQEIDQMSQDLKDLQMKE